MQQNIRYTGLANNPSDYDCSDGQLATAIGLVSEDDALKGVPQPQVVGASLGNRRVFFLHATSLYRHYIVVNTGATYLYWIDEEYLIGDYTPQQVEQHLVEITHTIGTVLTVIAVGNTLAVMTDRGLYYFLWKNNAYKNLGQKPPELEIRFSTTNQHSLISNDTVYANWCENTSEIWRLIASNNKLVTDANRFYAPFKIRYCYRLFDGSMFMHSAPVFMPITAPYTYQVEWLRLYVINNSIYPLPYNLSMAERTGGTNWRSIPTPFKYRYEPNNVSLRYRVLTDISAQLEVWADIVKSVDVFVTPPILREVTGSTLDPDAYKIEQPIYHYRGGMIQKGGNLNVPDIIEHDSSKFVVQDIPLYTEDEYLAKIKEASTFYKIASFDLAQKQLVFDSEQDLPIGTGVLSTLASQEAMVDDYRTHNNLVPAFNRASLFSYNNRLNISSVNDRLFQGFNLATMMPYHPANQYFLHVVKAAVCLQTNDGEKIVSKDMSCWVWPTFLNQLPLFYPDSRAKKLLIQLANDPKWYRLDMEECPLLNGATTVGDILEDISVDAGRHNITVVPAAEYPPDPLPDGSDIVNTVNKVYTSEVDNPYLFPATAINSVGTGEILALCTTTKALSQGQFGQFPLYAFTTDGVWALSVAADGTYDSMHAVSRDMCTNPYSITQIDSAVLFVTDRGIMLLQGSDTVCITDGILADNPFDPATLPHLDEVAYSENGYHVANAPMTHDFLAGCRMIYDYMHQHIIVFNPETTSPDGRREFAKYPYAHVYSLKSKRWGMMRSNLVATVNSYPDALAINRNRQLVSFASSEEQSVKGLLVTRPFKLGSPDAYKTIHNVVQRGVFPKGKVKTLLYGSRDLYNWHLVGSSVDHWLRGLRGTPFKYFRIALLTDLAPGESVSAVTVDFEPKETTKLH